MKITKKDYYKKKKNDCPCCGWHGMSETNRRKWLATKNTNKLMKEEYEDSTFYEVNSEMVQKKV